MKWARVDVTFATPAEDDETDHDVLRRAREALASGLTLADVDTPKKKRGAER